MPRSRATVPTPSRSSMIPALVVPEVATTATIESGSGSASSAARSASPVKRWSAVRDDERVDVDDRQRVLDRRVRLVAHGDAQPAVPRLLAVALDEATARGVARHDERREVAGRAAGHERAARASAGRPAASAIQRSAWFSAATAPAASSHEMPCSDAAETTMSNSSDGLGRRGGDERPVARGVGRQDGLAQVLGVDLEHARGVHALARDEAVEDRVDLGLLARVVERGLGHRRAGPRRSRG